MKHVLVGVFIGAGVTMAGFGVPAVLSMIAPPTHEIHSQTLVDTGPIIPGGSMTYEAVITRRAICDSTVYRFIWDETTGALVLSQERPGNALGVVDHEALRIRIAIPDDFEPGPYRLTAFVRNDCGGAPFVTYAPDVRFTVEAG